MSDKSADRTEERLRSVARAFGNERNLSVRREEFGGTRAMWSVCVNEHPTTKGFPDYEQSWHRIGYGETLGLAIDDAFDSIERAKAQTLLAGPEFTKSF